MVSNTFTLSRLGSISCTECPEGQYTNSTGGQQCSKCAPGTYASGMCVITGHLNLN